MCLGLPFRVSTIPLGFPCVEGWLSFPRDQGFFSMCRRFPFHVSRASFTCAGLPFPQVFGSLSICPRLPFPMSRVLFSAICASLGFLRLCFPPLGLPRIQASLSTYSTYLGIPFHVSRASFPHVYSFLSLPACPRFPSMCLGLPLNVFMAPFPFV